MYTCKLDRSNKLAVRPTNFGQNAHLRAQNVSKSSSAGSVWRYGLGKHGMKLAVERILFSGMELKSRVDLSDCCSASQQKSLVRAREARSVVWRRACRAINSEDRPSHRQERGRAAYAHGLSRFLLTLIFTSFPRKC